MDTEGNGSARRRRPVSGSSSAIAARKGRNEILAPLAPLDPLGTALQQGKLTILNDVARSEIRWLVPDLVPLGSIAVVDGAKSEGKSAIAYDWAARVTAGRLMPFCEGKPVGGGAILLQAEDDLGATVKASIEAAGGDPRRIRVYTKAEPLYLDDPEDLAMIRRASEELGARLLVADPFSEFFNRTLKDEKTIRNSFRLLRWLAAELQMAVILVRHFTKSGNNPLYRGLGGVAVINAARAALVVAKDPSSDDPYQHVLAFNRGNLPRTREVSLSFRSVKRGDAIVIEWLGESRYSAEDLLSAARSADAHSQLQEACYVLYAILAANGSPMPATQVYAAAQDALVSLGTLKRAKKLLRVRSRRKSFDILAPVKMDKAEDDGKQIERQTVIRWVWELPDDEELLRPYKERFEREQRENEQPAQHAIRTPGHVG